MDSVNTKQCIECGKRYRKTMYRMWIALPQNNVSNVDSVTANIASNVDSATAKQCIECE